MNKKVYITVHACERYIDRYNPALASIEDRTKRMKRARYYILLILDNAAKVREDTGADVLFNKEFNLNFILRKNKLITLFQGDTKKKIKRRNKQMANGAIHLIISMPDGSKWKVAYALLLVKYITMKNIKDYRDLEAAARLAGLPPSIEERIEIFRKEIEWREIKTYAACVKYPRHADYQSGWESGELKMHEIEL